MLCSNILMLGEGSNDFPPSHQSPDTQSDASSESGVQPLLLSNCFALKVSGMLAENSDLDTQELEEIVDNGFLPSLADEVSTAH